MYTALFWAITLLINKDKGESAKTLLGLFMVSIFILDLCIMLFYHHENTLYLYVDPINTFLSISTFLIFYWYIKLLTKEPKIRPKNLWLLTPGLLFATSSTLLYVLMSPSERINYIDNFTFRYNELTNITPLIRLKIIDFYASKIAFILSVFYAIIKCLQLMKKYNDKISNYYSNLSGISINWIQYLMYGLTISGIISILVNSLSQPFMLNANIATSSASFFFGSIIFTIGYFGFKQDYNISNIESFTHPIQDDNTLIIHRNPDELQVIVEKIVHLFKHEKIHRKQDLKISDISSILNTNRSYISKIINTQFNRTFIEFVNGYRIDDAKVLFETKPQSPIIEISHMAGFNSPSTFTRVFKQHVGESPSIYRKKQEKTLCKA